MNTDVRARRPLEISRLPETVFATMLEEAGSLLDRFLFEIFDPDRYRKSKKKKKFYRFIVKTIDQASLPNYRNI